MKILNVCAPSRDLIDQSMDRCSRVFPCLSDPGKLHFCKYTYIWKFLLFQAVICLVTEKSDEIGIKYTVRKKNAVFIFWGEEFCCFWIFFVLNYYICFPKQPISFFFFFVLSWWILVFRWLGFSSEIRLGSESFVGVSSCDLCGYSFSILWRFDREN